MLTYYAMATTHMLGKWNEPSKVNFKLSKYYDHNFTEKNSKLACRNTILGIFNQVIVIFWKFEVSFVGSSYLPSM